MWKNFVNKKRCLQIPIEHHPEIARLVGVIAAHASYLDHQLYSIHNEITKGSQSNNIQGLPTNKKRMAVKNAAACHLSSDLASRIQDLIDGVVAPLTSRRHDLMHRLWVTGDTKDILQLFDTKGGKIKQNFSIAVSEETMKKLYNDYAFTNGLLMDIMIELSFSDTARKLP